MHVQTGATAAAEPAYLEIRHLLQQAHRSLTADPAKAERCIAGAVRLLPQAEPAPDRPADAAPPLKSGLAPWQVLRVKALVEADLARRLSSADLAAATRLSPSHFTRAFKRSFGESPKTYVNRRRIVRSKLLMLQTREPLNMVALACGLADQAHFCRLFRRYEGQSPAVWRRLNTVAEPLSPAPDTDAFGHEARVLAWG